MTSQRKTLDIGNKLVRGSVSAKIEKSIYILGNKGELLEFKTEEFNVVSRTSFPESSNRYGIFFTRDNKIFTLSKDLI